MYEKENGLPELVRQTGPIKGNDRVYIEDYAYSYLRELKKQVGNTPIQAAIYGKAFRKEEGHVYLIYGVVPTEDEAYPFFSDYEMLGYVNLCDSGSSGEELDGCYVFYEANDAMQEYLLSQNRQNMLQEEQLFGDEKTKDSDDKGKASAIVRLIQKLLLTVILLLTVVAVTAINHYENMCEFALMVAKATQSIP